jgi:hypothetical protein
VSVGRSHPARPDRCLYFSQSMHCAPRARWNAQPFDALSQSILHQVGEFVLLPKDDGICMTLLLSPLSKYFFER